MKQLYTRWGERLDSEHILQEYPRPILIRNTDYTILNGEWEYTFTENSERPVEYDGKILNLCRHPKMRSYRRLRPNSVRRTTAAWFMKIPSATLMCLCS